MRTACIHELLRQNESTTLDFKLAQYPIVRATDEQKSELVKDILAFANANRTTDAHILIGVTERKGRPATITGITEHLDDAHLQQLINTKTNELTITAAIHADNLPKPVTTTLSISLASEERKVTLMEALALYNLN